MKDHTQESAAQEPHPPSRHCMCSDCAPSFEDLPTPAVPSDEQIIERMRAAGFDTGLVQEGVGLHFMGGIEAARALLSSVPAAPVQQEPVAWIDDDDMQLLSQKDGRHYVSACNRPTASCKNPLYAAPVAAQPQTDTENISALRYTTPLMSEKSAAQPQDVRRFRGVGELERTGYIPAGSGDEREAAQPVQDKPQDAGQALSESYVQTVPDKCDRIVWRGGYIHLPVSAQAAPAVQVQDKPQEAPEAPARFDNSEASAWQSGWESGYQAAMNRPTPSAPAQEKNNE